MSKISEAISAILPHHLTAVILAAGTGTRMENDEPKQFIKISGKSILERSVEAFENAPSVNDIIIVTSSEYIDFVKSLINENHFKKVTAVVNGGDSRRKSAFAGMESVGNKTNYIAIHDAARCLVTPEMIESVAKSAFAHGASFAAMPVKDTIKIIDKNYLTLTDDKQIKRSCMVCAATPQIFKMSLYTAAAYTAEKEGYDASDDTALVEHIGFACRYVDCGYENIKITTPQDIATAEYILRMRGEKHV